MIERIKQIKINELIMSLISAWCIINIIFISKSEISFMELSYITDVNLGIFLLGIIVIFAIIYGVSLFTKNKYIIPSSLMISIIYLSVKVLTIYSNFYLAITMIFFISICGFYIFSEYADIFDKINISDKSRNIIIVVLMILWFSFVAGYGICKYLSFRTPNFDFGIFSQMYYYLKNTGIPYTTTERSKLLSHFAVHVSPIFYSILPVYLIFQSPITLLVCQALAIIAGLIPLVLIGKHFKFSNKELVAISFIYCMYPSLIGGCSYDFHENKFITVLILWMFYFYETNKQIPMYIFMVLTLMVKEDSAVIVACIGLFFLLSKKDIKRGIIVLSSAILYFLGTSYYLQNYGQGIMSSRFNNLIVNSEDGLVGMIKTVILNPVYSLSQIFEVEKWEFICCMFIPLAFLPILSKNVSRLTLLIPVAMINLLTDYKYQYSINFQYTYSTAAILFYLTLLNLKDMSQVEKNRKKQAVLLFMMMSALMLNTATMYPKSNYIKNYIENRDTYAKMEEILDTIPKEASVEASTFLVAYLSSRDEIYELKNYKDTDYVIIDLRPGYQSDLETMIQSYLDLGYKEIKVEENMLAIYKK